MKQRFTLRDVPRWLVEALVTAAAFWLAYNPLRGRPEALSLALTAMAAVGYTALTFELMLLGRRQVRALTSQVSMQRDELEQSRAALEQQRQEAARQAQHAEETREVAHRSFLESVYARYDVSSPQVSISIPDRAVHRFFRNADGPPIRQLPQYIEGDDLDTIKLTVRVMIELYNFGPNAVLITNAGRTSGKFTDSNGDPWPHVWLLKPASGPYRLPFEWRLDGTVRDMLPILTQTTLFGVNCTFEVRDLFGNVTDTHTLDFQFTAIERDGSRAKIPPDPAPIILKSRDGCDTGGVATVVRAYREPPEPRP
ncbi:hypothetical protein [Flindersiella endophytica]